MTRSQDTTTFYCLKAAQAQYFLLTIPIYVLDQNMSLIEYRIILRYRLMIPLFSIGDVCPICIKVCLDTFREHIDHCRGFQTSNSDITLLECSILIYLCGMEYM